MRTKNVKLLVRIAGWISSASSDLVSKSRLSLSSFRLSTAHAQVMSPGIAIFVVLLFLITLASAEDIENSTVLINNGAPCSVILASLEMAPEVSVAIAELNEHLEKMSGATIPVLKMNPAEIDAEIQKAKSMNRIPILLDQFALTPQLEELIRAKGDDPASFVIQVDHDKVTIAGLSPQGTLNGVYELLEQMGCRWFTPGDFGTVIPDEKTVSIATQLTIQSPSFEGRHLQRLEHYEAWNRRMRLGGQSVPGAHGIDVGDVSLESNPDLFALVDGERCDWQLCISNPEVLHRAIEQTRQFFRQNPNEKIVGMGPGDGRGFCECDQCRALDAGDWDPFAKITSITDRYVWFFNQVLEAISDEFPDHCITFYAYDGTMRPPVREKPNPRIIPTFAPIKLCHIHGISNPVCPERNYYKSLLTQWSNLGLQIIDRGYILNYSGFPISHVHNLRDDLPLLKQAGVTRIRRETLENWGNLTPSLYIAAKLLWNVDADVDALEKDFYDKFFGSSSVPMSRYFERLDIAFRDVDHHPRWEDVDMAKALPLDQRQACRNDLDEAAVLAKSDLIKRRVEAFRLMFDSLELHHAVIQEQDAFDFVAANDRLQQFQRNQDQALKHDPPLLCEHSIGRLSQTIQDAYEKTTGRNKLLVALEHEWEFLIDPVNIGEELGYWKPSLTGGNWEKRSLLSPKSKSVASDWKDDLLWYSGDAWYRTTVTLSKAAIGDNKVSLWFRRLPKGSKLWLNSRLIDVCDGETGTSSPYNVDVTDAVASDDKNVITIKATGPVYSPAMFYLTKP
jgi:hypothetical protein